MELIFAPIWLVMVFPWLALVPAFSFLAYFARHQPRFPTPKSRRPILGAAAVWFAYAPYEWFMLQWSEGVVAPIRIDLLVIAPLLYASLFFGIRSCVRAGRRARSA